MRALKYLLLGFFVWAVANMSAAAVEEFMRSPYGAIADVRMLNFFRDLGETASYRSRRAGRRVGAGAEFLVPLSLSLRSSPGTGFIAEPVAHTTHIRRVHRLRQVRESLPLRVAGRQAGLDQVCGVYRMSRVRERLSVRRRAANEITALDADSEFADGFRHGPSLLELPFYFSV